MFFPANTTTDTILKYLNQQLAAIKKDNGVDVVIKPHTKQRTLRQNKFFHAVCANIVKFYQDTGFMPTGLSPWAMRPDIIKEFFKAFFGVEHTSKLTTKELGEFVDRIQALMVEQSNGEYEPIIPEDDYLVGLENMS